MEELELFVQEIDNLCCIIDEGASVRELLVLGKQFVERSESQLQLSLESLEAQPSAGTTRTTGATPSTIFTGENLKPGTVFRGPVLSSLKRP